MRAIARACYAVTAHLTAAEPPLSTRTLTDRLSLRQLLTLPYVGLVLALLLMMGALSWRAGSDTVDTLSRQLLAEAVDRISAHMAGQ